MRIHVKNDISYEDLTELIKNGASFIAYQYIISIPIFYPIVRFSKLYFIEANEKRSKFALKYNIFNVIFGFWGMPFGPPVMIKTIKTNNKGGIDFTEDIMVNIDHSSFLKREVKMEKPARFFLEPSRSNNKEFQKIVKNLRAIEAVKGDVIAGKFINTAENENPYYVLGISSQLNPEKIQIIETEIYKRFYKHTKVQIISLSDSNYEFLERLKAEGLNIE